MAEDISFPDFIETVKRSIRSVAEGFDDPEDDFAPMMFLWGKSEKSDDRGMIIAGIDGQFLSSEEGKDKLALNVLPGLVIEAEAKHFCFLSSTYVSKMTKGDQPKTRPSEDPDRLEAAMISAGSADGSYHLEGAMLLRDGEQAPALGKWGENLITVEGNVADENSEKGVLGRFFEPPMLACLLVNAKP